MTKIIAELGINHHGNYEICKKLIKEAYLAGSWGVKFQYRNLENYNKLKLQNQEIGKELIDKEIKRNYLLPQKIISLSKFSRELGLKAGISFFDEIDIKDFEKYNFDFYKIPSACSDNINLFKRLKKKIN